MHVDVKKVARIPECGGWRACGEGELRHPDSGAGTACLHVAVDYRSRVAYAVLLGDERGETCAGRRARASWPGHAASSAASASRWSA